MWKQTGNLFRDLSDESVTEEPVSGRGGNALQTSVTCQRCESAGQLSRDICGVPLKRECI